MRTITFTDPAKSLRGVGQVPARCRPSVGFAARRGFSLTAIVWTWHLLDIIIWIHRYIYLAIYQYCNCCFISKARVEISFETVGNYLNFEMLVYMRVHHSGSYIGDMNICQTHPLGFITGFYGFPSFFLGKHNFFLLSRRWWMRRYITGFRYLSPFKIEIHISLEQPV